MNQNPTSALNAAQRSVAHDQGPWQPRYGCIAARVGASFAIKTTVPFKTQRSEHKGYFAQGARSGVLHAGQTLHLAVASLAVASPEALAVMKWVCKHPACKGEKWESKEELLAGHSNDAKLAADQQTHVYFAVAEAAYVPGTPAKRDAEGNELEPAVPPSGFVELYSDEA
ncbi:MAG TPA: hypothetical protein VGI10_22710 [Polyangiaceae bacterium]|jgi:hypothetical protein